MLPPACSTEAKRGWLRGRFVKPHDGNQHDDEGMTEGRYMHAVMLTGDNSCQRFRDEATLLTLHQPLWPCHAHRNRIQVTVHAREGRHLKGRSAVIC